jgi:hypothetical protein
MAKRAQHKANPAIDKMMKALLAEVKTGQDENGKAYTLVDKMRVVDRVLKWEAIKTKMESSDWGSAFEDQPNEE